MERIQKLAESTSGENWAALNTKWEGRTQLAAEWLRDERAVADIGCGLMSLERFLPASTTYIPMDVVRRDERTIVFDQNKDLIPKVDCDAAVVLGVLEYAHDISFVLEQLRQFPKILLSYNHISINDLLWKLGLRTKRVTWSNRYTRRSFAALLKSSGLRIVRQRPIRIGERLYEVRPSPS